ncbi:MAG TPA: rhomboid family intramembrane serine protease [Thermoanaerobaculia bacterium]|nr:rhomboid family intramembrane serine protease [Thermoanaerobaculia bacterium]
MIPIRDTIPRQHFPFAVWTLIAVNIVVFIYELKVPRDLTEQFIYLFGLVPARFTDPGWAASVGFPHTYWPFLTTMFLHGGWLHIIGNMWVLWIFGDNVEDRMGPVRFLLFYLLCGLAAGAVHVLTNPRSQVPAVGASGAIAGVMAAYFVLFPRARIVAMFPIFFYPVFFQVPAFIYLGFWFLTQFFSGTLAIASQREVSGIAWWAHVGGFGAGILTFSLFLRPRQARPAVPTGFA